jgi:hypothetical protein
MARFKIGDRISYIRKFNSKIYDIMMTGTIQTECFVVDGIDHYRVNWEEYNRYEFPTNQPFDIISDLPSKKYEYIKAKFKFLK